MSFSSSIPWVEKYRPSKFEDIVLDPLNRELFEKNLHRGYFPNMLFYGPPGTGKTTTIINLINEYQQRYGRRSKANVIHLNASDERGVDIIRNQIHQFVKSSNLFETGLKFVILDEADYMTKIAQQALKCILQTCSYNVRFCLICNYITRIDDALKKEFISIRFNQLPTSDVFHFIRNIAVQENIVLSDETISILQEIHNSDIRSMINCIQGTGTQITATNNKVLGIARLDELYLSVLKLPRESLLQQFHELSTTYNIDKRTVLQKLCNHILRNHSTKINSNMLKHMELFLHRHDIPIETILGNMSLII